MNISVVRLWEVGDLLKREVNFSTSNLQWKNECKTLMIRTQVLGAVLTRLQKGLIWMTIVLSKPGNKPLGGKIKFGKRARPRVRKYA